MVLVIFMQKGGKVQMKKYRINWYKFIPRVSLLVLFIISTVAIAQCEILDNLL